MNISLVNHNVAVAITKQAAIAEVYKICKQQEAISDSVEDTEIFFRLWELHSRKYYFYNQIKELDNEIEEIINKKI